MGDQRTDASMPARVGGDLLISFPSSMRLVWFLYDAATLSRRRRIWEENCGLPDCDTSHSAEH